MAAERKANTKSAVRRAATGQRELSALAGDAPGWVLAIRETILRIPRGSVSTYGIVAEAAGYPGYHRQVAQVLNRHGYGLPWHRVLGAGGQIKTCLETAFDQRARLEIEGVKFKGRRVDMSACGHQFAVSNRQRGK